MFSWVLNANAFARTGPSPAESSCPKLSSILRGFVSGLAEGQGLFFGRGNREGSVMLGVVFSQLGRMSIRKSKLPLCLPPSSSPITGAIFCQRASSSTGV